MAVISNLFDEKIAAPVITPAITPQPKSRVIPDLFTQPTQEPTSKKIEGLFEEPKDDWIVKGLKQIGEQVKEHPIKTVLEAGARYPKSLFSGLEALQLGKPPLEAMRKGFLPETAPLEKERTPTQIAWDMADRMYQKPSTSVAWNFIKNLPFTTAGKIAEFQLDPSIFLAFQGINKVLTNPFVAKFMAKDIPAPKWVDDTISNTVKGFSRPFESMAESAKENRINAITDEIYKKFEPRLDELKGLYKDTYRTEATEADLKGLIKVKLIQKGIYDEPLINLQAKLFKARKIEPLEPTVTSETGIVPVTKPAPVVEPTTPIVTPKVEIPINKIPLAVRLNNGEVVSDNTANMHADILTNKGVNPDNVTDVGFIDENGKYVATKAPDWKGGEIIQGNLPEVPKGVLDKVKEAVLPTGEGKFNTEIKVAAEKTMRAGETLEENIARTKDWISSTLTNDENSTNAELVDYFQKEGGFSKDVAEYIVSKREKVRELPLGVKKEMPSMETQITDKLNAKLPLTPEEKKWITDKAKELGIPQEQEVLKKLRAQARKVIYVQTKYSEEDLGILKQIRAEVGAGTPGHKYVTRDTEGNVVKAGIEAPTYPPYFQDRGLTKKNTFAIIDKVLTRKSITDKHKEVLDELLTAYKEIINEKQNIREIADEPTSVTESEIREADRIAESQVFANEEVSKDSGVKTFDKAGEADAFIDEVEKAGGSAQAIRVHTDGKIDIGYQGYKPTETQTQVFPETKLDTNALYEQYYKDFISKKYSIPEAKRRAKLKLALAVDKVLPKETEEKQIGFQGGAAGFGTQEKGQEELFNKPILQKKEKTSKEYLKEELDKKRPIMAADKKRFEANIPLIENELKTDLERHPAAIIANYGFTFYDDIAKLRRYAEQTNHPLVVMAIDEDIKGLEKATKPKLEEAAKEEINIEEAKRLNDIFIKDEIRQANVRATKKASSTKKIESSPEAIEAWDKLRSMGYRLKSPMLPQQGFNLETKHSPTPSGGAQASYYGTNIDDFEAVGAKGSQEEFKLFEKVKALTHKFAQRVGEKYTGRRAVGLFYPNTKNIFLRALNNMSVAIHEITHYLDDKFKIVAPLMEVTGETSQGKPMYDRNTLPMRKALTDVYERYYPGGKRTHKLSKRMSEGIATFIQKYIEKPTQITYDYPLLVKEFLTESGKYHDPILTDFIREAREIIREYQNLDPLSKVKSRVISSGHTEAQKSFLKLKEKIYTEVCDDIFPIEKLGGDLHLWTRFYRVLPGFIANNIVSDKGYHTIKDGEFVKLYDYNWHTIISKLHDAGATEDFGGWLFARDTYFQYKELDKIRQGTIDALKSGNAEREKPLSEAEIIRVAESAPEYRRLALILDKNGITKEVAEKAYLDHKDRFEEEAGIYDKLVRADLDLLHDREVRLVNDEKYQELSSKEGYASLKRDVYNEILGEPSEEMPITKPRVGKTKISSMMSRHGSALAVINPLFNAVQNHNEIMRKAVKQMVYNKLLDMAPKYPELFQKLQVETSIDRNGRILFPQEKDPNIIMARNKAYKRAPLLVSKEVKQVLDEVLTRMPPHLVERTLTHISSLFTKGTTGLYVPFAITNILRDQLTAVAQTKNNIIPLYTPLFELLKELLNHDSLEANFFKEYMLLGGDKQTLANWLDLTPDQFFKKISEEKNAIIEVLKWVEEKGEFVLGAASKYSELLTRSAEYIKARQAGKTQLEALEEAGRVTAPFHHIGRLGGGTVGKTAIKMIPFFSPSIQAISQYLRQATSSDKKTRSRALFVLGVVTAAMVGSMYWLRKYGTKKQKEAIKAIQPQELATYIWLPSPDGENLIRLPIPQEMGAIGNFINMLVLDQLENAHYQPGEYIDGATAWIPDQLNFTDPERQLVSWIPQLAKPALEITLNRKTYPKITPIESDLMKELPPAERYTETTSGLGRALGGKLGLSPIQWDYLIEGYLGRSVKFATNKKIPNPIVREIYTLSMRQVENYYEIKAKAEQQANLMKKDPNNFTPEERNKIRSDYQKSQIIANNIRLYRKLYEQDKEKKDPRVEVYRSRILDGIDSLY